jgi:cell division protein ZipA
MREQGLETMSPLQWALLIFAVLAVVAIWWFSRRDKRALDQWQGEHGDDPLLAKPGGRQLDIFGGAGQQFDEFGVGKPRRVEPRLDLDGLPIPEPSAAPVAPMAEPRLDRRVDKPASQKIVSLLIADPQGQAIAGPQIHAALAAEGLEFGLRQIYHRLFQGEPVFSVASLLKPGVLDPESAAEFATPGLTLFMVLPGPVKPSDAIRDMIATAERLAASLGAEVYDARRQSFTPSSARSLQLEVEAWARLNPPAL